ncbi:hypothetical protein SARC_03208 [Sphaeroforma arctica JP610]|uniref:AB hydrolase-1 domain-containing protein n=1 Tax=Sphaeroforma arctica JP610 TaxID=667725 RepID=A0A0L0G6P5_9EUKA|nr:hypothetical protein SARC_03208 [Sphaeroforma arctica JP610]KNC84589.1 hypothetical protein SARC_03208 [Sphaeroforma arctica JP610]|eukprot:XP_014158491.1 hypothetical protein SARC_03208 [Sphaeroforma arctica JP610]
MPYANLKAGHKLYYDEFGASAGEAIVLVMGLNTQCIAWDDDFCELLSNDKKYRVVRFDNRDIGLSDKFETKEKYNIAAAYFKQMLRMKIKAPYSLVDMSNDVFGLMDCLNIDRAHIVGASMGGMISQICALQNQSRVLSMTSIMSTTSAHNLPSARFSLIRLMLKPKPVCVCLY